MREKIGLHKIFVISLLVLTFLLMQLIVPWAWINDETVYVLMADSLTKRGVYTIENEYDGSPQFIIHASTPVDGRLLPVPPPMYPILYGLQYMFLGVYGLQLTNLVAHILTVYLIYLFGKKLFDENTGYLAGAIYALSTFTTIYSIEIWPHSLSILLTVTPTYLILFSKNPRHHILAGLIAGGAFGLRYTNLINAGITLLYVVYIYRKTLRSILPYFFGLVFSTLIILIFNQTLYGSFLNTGYGDASTTATTSYRFTNLVFGAFIFVAVINRRHIIKWLDKQFWRRFVAYAFLIIVFCAILFFTNAISTPLKLLYSELIDFSFNIQYDGLWSKRALLQSSPILILAIFGAGRFKNKEIKYLFTAYVAAQTLFIAGVEYGDGSLRHMRYLLETVPYITLFAAPQLMFELKKYKPKTKEFILVSYFCGLLLILDLFGDKSRLQLTYKIPFLAALAYVLMVLHSSKFKRWHFAVLIVFLLIYGGVVNIAGLTESNVNRRLFYEAAKTDIEDGSVILYSDYYDQNFFNGMKHEKNITVFNLKKGGDYEKYISQFIEDGRKVYRIVKDDVKSCSSPLLFEKEYILCKVEIEGEI